MSEGSAPTASPPVPAPRTSDHLANERTFLAWIRTSIALISLGFVVAKFSVWLRQFTATVAAGVPGPGAGASLRLLPRVGVSLPAGLALMGAGAVLAVLALTRFVAIDRAIDRGDFRPARGLVTLVTVAVVLAALAFITYLSVTSF